jgi:hypothetical protein
MSSARGRKRKECTGKIKYDSMNQAVMVLKNLKVNDDLHTYKCQFCGKWHLGHMTYKIRKIIEQRKGIYG